MRHYFWLATVLAGAALAGTGCSSTGSQPSDRTSSAANSRGDVGNGAFGEAVPAQYSQPAQSRASGATNMDQGHGFTGNGAFGESP